MNRKEVNERLQAGIDAFLAHDSYLLDIDANERSITHKLAEHLKACFKGWHVDCEYNRNRNAPKILNLPVGDSSAKDTDARTVFPDIIVHRRGTEDNLLVIEVKKTTSRVSDKTDFMKLRAFVGQLRYLHAVFLKFAVEDQRPRVNTLWLGNRK